MGLNIVIIGASRGIGFQVTRHLTVQNHNLFCVSRNIVALTNLRNEIVRDKPGNKFEIMELDISTLNSGDQVLHDAISEQFRRVDILLNNAGLLINKKFGEFSREETNRIFDTNFFSAASVIQQLLPLMGGEKTSHIVNIGSMGGFQGSSKFAGLSYYSASKAALACLSECLAEEFKEKNIKVNCLALGAAQTEMLEEAFPGIKAPLTAEEIAEFIGQFMISGHRFFNGKTLPVSVSTP